MTFSSIYGTSPYGYATYATLSIVSSVTLGAVVPTTLFAVLNENRTAAASDTRTGLPGKDGRAYIAQELRATKLLTEARGTTISPDMHTFTAMDNRKTTT